MQVVFKKRSLKLLTPLRSAKKTAIPVDIVTQVFRGALGRQPSPKERGDLSSQLVLHGDLEAIVRDLIKSEEFSIQMLPQLVAKWTADFEGRRVFFLHVPKTAGTSVRLALGRALGVPAMQVYEGFIQPKHNTSFWPFWAGHSGIGRFPATHAGFTVFRESRSRMLSVFRQREYEVRTVQRIRLEGKTPVKGPNIAPITTKLWQASICFLENWYHLPSRDEHDESLMFKRPRPLVEVPEQKRREQVKKGMSRISYAAWAHKPQDLLDAVSRASGRSITSIPRENTIDHRTPNPNPVELTYQDLGTLNDIAERDQHVFHTAVSQGLIPPLDSAEADSLFHDTAKRLNFILP